MKKTTAVIMATILLLMLPFPFAVSATSATYDLDALELQVTIPDGYAVVTRDTAANDPVLTELGITKSDLDTKLNESAIYLNAVSRYYNEEIVVTMVSDNLIDLHPLADNVLEGFVATIIEQYDMFGLQVLHYDIYRLEQATFIRLYFTDVTRSVYGLQYYTIRDGKAVNFTMRSYEGSLSSRQEDTIRSIVDSVQYDHSITPEPDETTEPFTYTDIDTGLAFTVPTNWKQTPFSEDPEYLDAKFSSTTNAECTIIYSSQDMWNEMSSFEQSMYDRADVNTSLFTTADIAEMYNVAVEEVSTVTYNGMTYFKTAISRTETVYGIDITVIMTQFVCMHNAWIYTFQFSDTNTHELYPAFESLLNSVRYPNVVSQAPTTTTTTTTTAMTTRRQTTTASSIIEDDTDTFLSTVVYVVLAVIVIVIVTTISARINRKKVNATLGHPSNINTTSTNAPINYCSHCGQALSPHFIHCNKCGRKIDK